MNIIIELLGQIIGIAWDILNDASVWLIISFILAGLLHNVLKPDKFQRMLGNKKFSSLIKATISGVLLPICSCGVIPLGLGMYYSGAYLGPTLAFMTACPIINPAALILAFGLLGPQIAVIYMIAGFTIPILIGLVGNLLGGEEIHAPGIEENVNRVELEAEDDLTLREKIVSGLHWGFLDLGVMVSKYIVIGMLLAGLILALAPQEMIQQYLGDPGMVSLGGIAALGTIMYVCAVGHIPFIAALVASGAAPGIAITFLMTGAATNLPELISIYKTIGKRTVAIYTVTMVSSSFLVGYIANQLLHDFVPFFDFNRNKEMIGVANILIFAAPEPLQYLCSLIIIFLGVKKVFPQIKQCYTRLVVSK